MNNSNFRFTGKGISIFGGMKIMEEFFKKEKIVKIISSHWKNRKKSNNQIDETNIILSIITGILVQKKDNASISRLSKDWFLKEVVGIVEISKSVLSRFYNSLNHKVNVDIEKMIQRLSHQTMSITQKTNITVDCDATVKTVYGNQEGSAKGYNPHKPGRKSYNVQLAFVAESESFLHGTIRPGNSVSLTSIQAFVDEMLAKLPIWVKKVKLRLDSGYFSQDFFNTLTSREIEFFCTVKMNGTIQRMIWGLSDKEWTSIDEQREIAEMAYGSVGQRMIVVREKIEDPKNRPQGKLLINVPGYVFSGLITNALWGSTVEIWRFRNQRADVENRIKEVKEDFLQHLNCQSFWGNQAKFLFGMLAYEISNLLRKKYYRTHKDQHHRFRTFFEKYILIAVRKVCPQNRVEYQLDQNYLYQESFQRLMILLV